MKNILRAVAVSLMFASGAQAATVEPVAGDSDSFIFRTGNTAYTKPGDVDYNPALPDPFTVFSLDLTISDSGRTEVRSFIGGGDPMLNPILFDWVFSAGAARILTVSGFLRGYTNSFIDNNPYDVETMFISQFAGGYRVRDESIQSFTTNFSSASVAPMPIGGTLPLMLSALGLGALVMRRRAKRAAA